MATETEFVTAPSTPETLQIVVELEQRLRQHDGNGESSLPMTIFRVPARVRDANKELYEPQLVSIGPYYHGREALRAMEQHKWRYLHELLAQYPTASLYGCFRAVRKVEQKARRCYSERTDMIAGDFAEMLLLDGCFLLRLFLKWRRNEPDELCNVGWGLPLLRSDLFLLENQIPFFVLEALFTALFPKAPRSSLLKLIVPIFRLDDSPLCKDVLAQVVPTQAEEIHIHHLLHLLYEAFVSTAAVEPEASSESDPASLTPLARFVAWLLQMWRRFKTAVTESFAFVREMPRVPGWRRLSACMDLLHKVSAWFSKFLALIGVMRTRTEPPEPPVMVVPSATLLREAGVRFEKKASPRHMFDITFDAARGVLTMPRLKVDYADKPRLVNLIAFENTVRGLQGGGAAKLLSSYAALVGSLVRTGGDVEHLQRHDVIDNLLGCDDEAATKYFQHLGDCSSLDYARHHFAAMFADLNQYYHSSWRRHKAKFLRDHCSSPWAVLAFVVAGCAFCFGLVKFSTFVYGLTHPYCRC